MQMLILFSYNSTELKIKRQHFPFYQIKVINGNLSCILVRVTVQSVGY